MRQLPVYTARNVLESLLATPPAHIKRHLQEGFGKYIFFSNQPRISSISEQAVFDYLLFGRLSAIRLSSYRRTHDDVRQ